MTRRDFPYKLTSDDRATFAKWKRNAAIAYGCALLLLVAYVAAPRILTESAIGTAVAAVPAKIASPVAR